MRDKLKEIKLSQEEMFPYWCPGTWSMHQLLEHLLLQTGPADVWLSSLSISEGAARSFMNLKESGTIKTLNCLFNNQLKRYKTDLLYFVKNVATAIYLNNIHAKIIIIKNDNWNIAVISSANFTDNFRHESGVIFTQKNIVDDYLAYFNKVINESALFILT